MRSAKKPNKENNFVKEIEKKFVEEDKDLSLQSPAKCPI